MRSVLIVASILFTTSAFASPLPFKGKVPVKSMNALTFGPDGILFIGDSKAGAVWAVDVDDRKERKEDKAIWLKGCQARVAALLGTHTNGIMIHDLAVNPISQNAYLAVSRGGSQWDSRWQLPS